MKLYWALIGGTLVVLISCATIVENSHLGSCDQVFNSYNTKYQSQGYQPAYYSMDDTYIQWAWSKGDAVKVLMIADSSVDVPEPLEYTGTCQAPQNPKANVYTLPE